MSTQGRSDVSSPPNKVPKMVEGQKPFISWNPTGPSLHHELSGHKRPYISRNGVSNPIEYMPSLFGSGDSVQSTQNNSPAANGFGEHVLPRAGPVPTSSPPPSIKATAATTSTLQNGVLNDMSHSLASKNSVPLSNGSAAQPHASFDSLPSETLPSSSSLPLIANGSAPPTSATSNSTPPATNGHMPLQTQENSDTLPSLALDAVTQPPIASVGPRTHDASNAMDYTPTDPSPNHTLAAESSNHNITESTHQRPTELDGSLIPSPSNGPAPNGATDHFASLTTPHLYSMEAAFARRPSRTSAVPLPEDPHILQKCISALRRATLKMYSCPYAQNGSTLPYKQSLKITGLPQAVVKPFSEAFATLYPFVKIIPSELSNTHMLVVDPARTLDWSLYLLMLHGALVVKRTWIEETIKLNSPPVIDTYLITLPPDPLNGSLPYFSASLLRGNTLVLMEFACPNIGKLAHIASCAPQAASVALDMDLRYRIAFSLQFLGITFELWHDAEKAPAAVSQNSILLYHPSIEENRPPTANKSANSAEFAAIWTTHELLAYLSAPSSMPQLTQVPIAS